MKATFPLAKSRSTLPAPGLMRGCGGKPKTRVARRRQRRRSTPPKKAPASETPCTDHQTGRRDAGAALRGRGLVTVMMSQTDQEDALDRTLAMNLDRSDHGRDPIRSSRTSPSSIAPRRTRGKAPIRSTRSTAPQPGLPAASRAEPETATSTRMTQLWRALSEPVEHDVAARPRRRDLPCWPGSRRPKRRPEPKAGAKVDKRFKDPEWTLQSRLFDVLRESYLDHLRLPDHGSGRSGAEGVDEDDQAARPRFSSSKRWTAAFSPSNFLMTNPGGAARGCCQSQGPEPGARGMEQSRRRHETRQSGRLGDQPNRHQRKFTVGRGCRHLAGQSRVPAMRAVRTDPIRRPTTETVFEKFRC